MAIREGTGAVPQIADTVYGNGTILTMNPAQPEAEAVAVAGGVIIGVGALSDMKALSGAESRFVDLPGLHGSISIASLLGLWNPLKICSGCLASVQGGPPKGDGSSVGGMTTP